MELPTLVDQIIIICSVVSNKVSILVGRIIHAGGAVHEFFVDVIEVGKSVFLRIIPPVVEIFGFSITLVFGSQINVGLAYKVVVDTHRLVRLETVLVGVEGHLESSVGEGLDTGSNGIAIGVVAHLETVFVPHVHEASSSDNILVVINGPQVLGDLFDVLVELLTVDSQQFPFRVGVVTIQGGVGFVREVFVVLVALVVGVDVRSPHHPSGATVLGVSTTASSIVTTTLAFLVIAIDKGTEHSVGLSPLVVVGGGIRQVAECGVVGVPIASSKPGGLSLHALDFFSGQSVHGTLGLLFGLGRLVGALAQRGQQLLGLLAAFLESAAAL